MWRAALTPAFKGVSNRRTGRTLAAGSVGITLISGGIGPAGAGL